MTAPGDSGEHLQGTASASVHVRTVPLGGSALSQALQRDPGLHGWLSPRPSTVDEWRSRAAEVRSVQALSDWHTVLAPAFAATDRARLRLARAASDGVVVTTGQQPGLFGGPTYTFTKAIAALALADSLEEHVHMPVAPVFWAATDDADWMEAAVTHVLDPDGLATLTLPGSATQNVSMSNVRVGDVTDALQQLRAASGSAPHGDVLDAAERAYVAHATIGDAFVQLLRTVLEPLGIAVLDASHPAMRSAIDPFLRKALTRASAISSALAARADEIRREGFEPQVEAMDSLSLVFQSALTASGRSTEQLRERVSIAEAGRAMREAAPGTLGANVLLRPIIERCVLPTVSYVAGPGEYAYFAQVAPIARALDFAVPLVVPRWAGEVISEDSVQLRRALDLDEAELDDPHAAETRLARARLDDGLGDALDRLRVTLETQIRSVASANEAASELVNGRVITGVHRDVSHTLDRFERRLLAATKRRETRVMREVARVRAAFRPLGASPERVLNLLPFLARHGTLVLDRMREEAARYATALVTGQSEAAPADS